MWCQRDVVKAITAGMPTSARSLSPWTCWPRQLAKGHFADRDQTELTQLSCGRVIAIADQHRWVTVQQMVPLTTRAKVPEHPELFTSHQAIRRMGLLDLDLTPGEKVAKRLLRARRSLL